MSNKLKAITTKAKALYKTGKFAKWTDAIKAASKKIGYSDRRLSIEKEITKEMKSAPKTLFPYTEKQKIIQAGKKVFDKKIKELHKNENLGAVKKRKPATKKATAKKSSYHKDTKSHNVNIKVVSGIKKEQFNMVKTWQNIYGKLAAEYVAATNVKDRTRIKKEMAVVKELLRDAKKLKLNF